MFATMDLGYAEKLPPCDALYGSFSGGGQPCDEYAGNELAIWTAVVFLAHGAITVVLGAVGPRGVLVAWVTAPGTWLLAIMALQSLAAALIPFVVWVLVPAAIPPLGASLIPALSGRTGSRGTFG